jgi:TPR repeat protein
MYLNGQGVAKDLVEGLAWLDLAAAGDSDAAANRAALVRQLDPTLVASAQQRSRAIAAGIASRKEP